MPAILVNEAERQTAVEKRQGVGLVSGALGNQSFVRLAADWSTP
jgi:hypothetical protein